MDVVEKLRSGHPCDEAGKPCRSRDARAGCFCAEVADVIERLRKELGSANRALKTNPKNGN